MLGVLLSMLRRLPLSEVLILLPLMFPIVLPPSAHFGSAGHVRIRYRLKSVVHADRASKTASVLTRRAAVRR